MIPISILVKRVTHALNSNSPAILTAIGVSGTITTAYLAAQAGYKQAMDEDAPPGMTPREKVERHWRLYVPAGVSAVVTIGAVVGASKVSSRKTAAIAAAYSISEKAFTEYKDKVVEVIGENKERAVRDEIAQDRVNDSPPGNVIIAAGGQVLCCEMYTGRYFQSDMETLRKAQNTVNDKLNREMYTTLSEFYWLLGLPTTTYSSDMGWTAGRMMELQFSTVMSPDEKPCLAFEYNYVKPID